MSGESITVAIWILIFLLIAGVHMSDLDKGVHDRNPVAHDYKRIMAYHGAQVLYEDYNGNIWFLRDGRKVYIIKRNPDEKGNHLHGREYVR